MKQINTNGYTLIEMILVIIILSIISSVAIKSLNKSTETARVEETKKELIQLANSIRGNPSELSGGKRIDFGYIGDIGALPNNLDNLVQDPGLGNWSGPYLHDNFYNSSGAIDSEFKIDGWGKLYSYSGGNFISSSGNGSDITVNLANSVTDLLYNSVSFVITDIKSSPPGLIYKDSVSFNLTIPSGAGGWTTMLRFPTDDGMVQFDSIPIGIQNLQIVYYPTADTLIRKIHVNPGSSVYMEISLNEELW